MAKAYRTHPVHIFPWIDIHAGFDALASELTLRMAGESTRHLVIIEGFVGIQWNVFVAGLRAALETCGVSAAWLSTDGCLLEQDRIASLLHADLTDDPYFGRVHRGHLEELWHREAVFDLRQAIDGRRGPCLLYGFGASLLAHGDTRIYVDVPKDRGQELAARGEVTNVGATSPAEFGEIYKRFYVVDWPMLNRVKRNMMPRLDLFVDATNSAAPTFVHADMFRRALAELAHQPFRLKPWFTPGVWGGQWMKERFGLPDGPSNYAWSFELIAPENGLLIGDGAHVVECSFDYLLWSHADEVMGPTLTARYGTYFPLRFDYLDTVDGGNLSLQVHASPDFMREEHGEPIAEDETYYILDSKPGARVYLGLQDDVDLEQFKADAEAARDHSIPFDYDQHVASFPSEPHDLFLIPNGTIHSSGKDNLVLEISATPYMHTYKVYDYLRKDLRGQLRHMHLDQAFANLDATRTKSWAAAHLIPRPVLFRQGADWAEYCIGNIDQLFFAIHRLEFASSIEDHTDNKVLAINMVAGEACDVLVPGAAPVELRYAESMIIPASIGPFMLRNSGPTECKVVKLFVKG